MSDVLPNTGADIGSPTTTGSGDLLSKTGSVLSGANDFLKKNSSLLGAIASGGGLLMNMLNQPKFPSVQSELGPIIGQANQLNAQGTQLEQYLGSGTLPPGVQQGLNSASAAAKAAIRSKYAALGPGEENSSAALADIANVDVIAETQGANIAMNLLQQGVSETQLSSQLYTELLNATLANDQQLSSAIGNLAGSLVPRQTVINTGSTTSTAA